MRAFGQDGYGPPDVLDLREVEVPTPGAHDVSSSAGRPCDPSTCTSCAAPVRGPGFESRLQLRGPRLSIRGRDVAGAVEAVGRLVARSRPGEEVYGVADGTFADFASAADDAPPKAANLAVEQAAAVPVAATTALPALRHLATSARARRAHQRRGGRSQLLRGAVAKALGAESTGVQHAERGPGALSGRRRGHRLFGRGFRSGLRSVEVILDLVGNHSVSACRRALAPDGILLLSHGGRSRWFGPFGSIIRARLASAFSGRRLFAFTARVAAADLMDLKDLAESGQLTPVIDRSYSLADAVDALRYLETGHARGKVVVTV